MFGKFADLYDRMVATHIHLALYEKAFHLCERMKTRALGDMLAQKEFVPATKPF